MSVALAVRPPSRRQPLTLPNLAPLTVAQTNALRAIKDHGTIRGAARSMGITPNALKGRLREANRRLRDDLAQPYTPPAHDERGLTRFQAEAVDARTTYPTLAAAARALGVPMPTLVSRLRNADRNLRAGSPPAENAGAASSAGASFAGDCMLPPHSAPVIRAYLYGELTCTLCSATVGSLVTPYTEGLLRFPDVTTFYQTGTDEPRLVTWRRLRCARCNGMLLVDAVSVVKKRVETVDWRDPWAVRRGRPPKWLVEQRRQVDEENERIAALLSS